MNKKRRLSLSLSLFLLLLSHSLSFFLLFSLSPLLSLSPMLTFSILSHTQTLPPLHVITASKDRRERETYIVLKRMLTFKKRRVNVPNSLSLSFPRPHLPPSLLHILSLSLLFMSAYITDIWANALLKEGCQCLNILLISSRTQSPLIVSVCLSRV